VMPRAKLFHPRASRSASRVFPGKHSRPAPFAAIEAFDFDYSAEWAVHIPAKISRCGFETDNPVRRGRTQASSPIFAFGRVPEKSESGFDFGRIWRRCSFLGAAAGRDPTAVAVVSDLMFIAESPSGGSAPAPPTPTRVANHQLRL